MYKDVCSRCMGNNIIDDDYYYVCRDCGLVHDIDPFDDTYSYTSISNSDSCTWASAAYCIENVVHERNRYFDRFEYREMYFANCLKCISLDHLSINEELLEDIKLQLDKEDNRGIRDIFRGDPNKKHTQSILRTLSPGTRKLQWKYASKKTGRPLLKYGRKNFIMKWLTLNIYLRKQYKITNIYTNLLTFDYYTILKETHRVVCSQFERLKLLYPEYGDRIALPSSKTFIILLMCLISPDTIKIYENILFTQSVVTTVKALDMIKKLCVIAYGEKDNIFILRDIMVHLCTEYYHYNFTHFPILRHIFMADEYCTVPSGNIKKIYCDKLNELCQYLEAKLRDGKETDGTRSIYQVIMHIQKEISLTNQ